LAILDQAQGYIEARIYKIRSDDIGSMQSYRTPVVEFNISWPDRGQDFSLQLGCDELLSFEIFFSEVLRHDNRQNFVNNIAYLIWRIEVMQISDILLWNNETIERNPADPQFDLPPAPFDDDLTTLANAFTRRGAVKHFWHLNGSESQPSGPAPPDPETELIPSSTLEPTMASWEAEPVEEEPPVGLHRPVPLPRY
jgi:hypothetical protein